MSDRALAVALVAALAAGCSPGSQTGHDQSAPLGTSLRVVDGAWPDHPPERIVVVPFMFGAGDMQAAAASGTSAGFGFLARREQRLARRQASDDETMAERFTDALVRDLQKRGFDARRAASGAPLPSAGWLVRGSFVELNDPASAEHISIPLFGSGNTGRVGLFVSVDDLAAGLRPIFEIGADGAGAGKPGGVPAPATLPIKLVLTQAELSDDAESLATQIADAIASRGR
ncbi:MAG TPA: DUF4410 domain-containing protein [Phycisphaerales bacterium]|nr:DUF4410 domain-containing protein [Phycisphaerales bacterium]HMP36043.1 DUF4410 domain-containing protein [Phycisphaerales bacterium]